MIRAGILARFRWGQHVLAAVACTAIVSLVTFDRRIPLEHIAGEIIPHNVKAGADVAVRWKIIWHRACEATVSRELVGSDLVVRAYQKYQLRIPTTMGQQVGEAQFVIAASQPPGLTAYRASLRFHDCGLTSRVWPLTIETPVLYFDVLKP